MSEERKPLFVECEKCNEIWKVCTLPSDCFTVSKALKNATCPNCHNQWNIFLCKTDGPDAVTEPRAGVKQ